MIGLEIVQLLRWLGLPEIRLRRRQLAGLEKLLPHPRRRRLGHVGVAVAIRPMRHVVADVDITLVARTPHHVVALVHAPAEAEEEFLRRIFILTQKCMTLHPIRRLDADETQERRRQIQAVVGPGYESACANGRDD